MEESADIRKAAVEAVYGRDGRGLIGRDRASLTDRVYRAIEQERKRCANIAEQADIDNATALWVKEEIVSGREA